jgi:hypothetical protein
MTDATPTAGRDTRGRFQPGQSGNPAGKKPGTLNHATRFRLLLEAGDFEAASRVIIEKARAGNLSAARFIVDHVDPRPRGRPITLDVPPEATLVERYAALTRAMLAGEISPQEAAAVARLLEREATLHAAEPARAPASDLHPARRATRPVAARDRPDAAAGPASRAVSPASDLHLGTIAPPIGGRTRPVAAVGASAG